MAKWWQSVTTFATFLPQTKSDHLRDYLPRLSLRKKKPKRFDFLTVLIFQSYYRVTQNNCDRLGIKEDLISHRFLDSATRKKAGRKHSFCPPFPPFLFFHSKASRRSSVRIWNLCDYTFCYSIATKPLLFYKMQYSIISLQAFTRWDSPWDLFLLYQETIIESGGALF